MRRGWGLGRNGLLVFPVGWSQIGDIAIERVGGNRQILLFLERTENEHGRGVGVEFVTNELPITVQFPELRSRLSLLFGDRCLEAIKDFGRGILWRLIHAQGSMNPNRIIVNGLSDFYRITTVMGSYCNRNLIGILSYAARKTMVSLLNQKAPSSPVATVSN